MEDCYYGPAAAGLIFGDTQLDQGACTEAQIDAFFDACFKAGASQASCDTFVGSKNVPNSANAGCVNCVFPFYNPNLDSDTAKALPSPAFVLGGRYIVANDEACRFKAANAPTGCGKQASDILYCVHATCGECDATDLNSCTAISEKHDCKDMLPEAECHAAYLSDKATADAKCGDGSATFEASFKPLALAFCGSP